MRDNKGFFCVFIFYVLTFTQVAYADNTLVPQGLQPYQPEAFPDRIILMPTENPAGSQSVSWRTGSTVFDAVAEISAAVDTPDLSQTGKRYTGTTRILETENGVGHHHEITFTELLPDTMYAYRVGGDQTWSEWLQFRTAKDLFEPYTIIYFGDAQNSVKSLFSRIVRQALLDAPGVRLMIHAGDLIDRYGLHDNHWGEWFDAGGWLHGMVNSLVVAGNHEYDEAASPVQLVPHWPVQFINPRNGPAQLLDSVYYIDYQQVRYIVLDSTQAVHDEGMAALQGAWLKQVLADNPALWTIVTYHHPMFSISHGRENPHLQKYWRPVFEEHNVDLVLQGHDHVYGRGQNVSSGTSGQLTADGPMYLVSVAGPKMNLLSKAAEDVQTYVGEGVQLYQLIHFSEDTIHYEARTASGRLYDAFILQREQNGRNRVVEGNAADSPLSRCNNQHAVSAQVDASGVPRPGRCWLGTEW